MKTHKKEDNRKERRLINLIVSDKEYVTFSLQQWLKMTLKDVLVADGKGIVYFDETSKRIDREKFELPYGMNLMSSTKLQEIELNAFDKGVEYERSRLTEKVIKIFNLTKLQNEK